MAPNTKDIQPAVDNLEGKQDGGKTTPKTAAEVLQTVKDLKTSFGDNEAGYRTQIDAIYNRIYADAKNDRSLNGLLPALDLADATVDKAGVGNDRGNFSGSDGRDYTQTGVGIDKGTGRALSVISADGKSGMIPGDNGTLQTFTTTGDGAQAQVHVNGVGANGSMYDFTYPPGSSAAVNRDQGTIDVTAPNGGPVSHIKSDGSEETKLANGADVTRQAPGSQIVTHYQLGGKDLIDANGNWVADAPGGLGGKKASDYEVDPANGNVTNKGHLDQVVAGVSDGKLIAGDTLPQNGLPPGVELPKVPGMPAAGDVKTTTVKDGVITVTTNKGDTIQYTQGKDDFKYTVAGGKTFDFHKNNDGGWTAMEDGPGHDILSINALRIDNGVVRFSEKNPLAADDHMMITKDGGIVEEPRH